MRNLLAGERGLYVRVECVSVRVCACALDVGCWVLGGWVVCGCGLVWAGVGWGGSGWGHMLT